MKKWFRTVCFLLFFFSGLLAADTAFAALPKISVAVSADEDASQRSYVNCWITSSRKGYLFLPAFYQPEQMYLYFDGYDTLTLDGREVHSGDAVSFSPNQVIQVSGKGFNPFTVTVMQSSPIPAIFINTESGDLTAIHKSKEVKEPGDMYMVNPDGSVEYDGNLKYIRTRGNSTFKYPKKGYQIKLKSAAPLCGMAKDKTFILLANYLDRSGIRNRIGLDLARYSGAYAFTVQCQPVDLYMNHAYVGCYLLTEKCEIDKDRLNITNLESAVEEMNDVPLESYPVVGPTRYRNGTSRAYQIPNEPEDITGGYMILGSNSNTYEKKPTGFVTKRGQAFIMQQPKYASVAQIAYVSGLMQQIENAIFAKDGRDPETGKHFSEFLDMKSFVNRYLQGEILCDHDAWRPTFYKDSDAVDAKVYCGPVWDQDNILGISPKIGNPNYLSIDREQKRDYYWFTRVVKHPDFREEMIKTYYAVYRHAYLILLGEETDETGTLLSVDAYTDEIRSSTLMDHTRWNKTTWRSETGGNPKAGEKPDECAAFIKEFIRAHMKVMDKAYPEPLQ